MRKVLLVEDETVLRETYQLILSTEPYIVHVAVDGREALDMCKGVAYDLILLDLMMPKVDGIAFLKKYQKTLCSDSKIIILSNLSSGEKLAEALHMGAYRSIVKSDVSPRRLLSLVRYELQS